MRLPKLRELKEAVTAVLSPRFTTQFPAKPCVVPEKYRGKPEFDLNTCIGCGACVNVCPSSVCLTMTDDLDANPPVRRITLSYYTCIFCGNCQDNCTTETGIKLSNQWDLATLDKESQVETHEFELQLCEKCGALIGTKKHLVWLYEKLGPLAYTNPSLLLAKSGEFCSVDGPPVSDGGASPTLSRADVHKQTAAEEGVQAHDFMRILCPKCKCELNIRL
ncbi:MAG TPA: 4Fe-4S dicluster domain-containing protein [Sedimentisphaerales bacterium]|nr:4Fe-4S dicluster domain-containing protein [Sedimentisphaerales bacterium]